MRYLIILACLSSTLHAHIRTCKEADELRPTGFITKWSEHKDRDMLRKQAEAAAMFYCAVYPNWDCQGSKNSFAEWSDQELNEYGEGIVMQYLGDTETLVQFGFGGGNYFEVIFERDSHRLSTRVYYWDGLCDILKDQASKHTSHLPGPGYYSKD
ncbi:MAG: hypothetical protein JKY15_05620 [Deltaproteobacteria bacterium]|nr:hypothetical protein [Deltaproteobacteria bacterium]